MNQGKPPTAKSMRIAIVQFAPAIGRVQDNINKAHEICSKLRPGSVDLVCLPEMIFTGYVFSDAGAISPFLEVPRTGPTSKFCESLARRLICYVAAGYPEKLTPEELGEGTAIGANSAVLYGPRGEWIGGYRKVNMFETDKTWAKPGPSIKSFVLPEPLETLSIGICMDLNPHPPAIWTLEDGPYELADYCRSTVDKPRTNVLLLLNAWLDSKEDPDKVWDRRTVNYWVARLRPLWDKDTKTGGPATPSEGHNPLGLTTVIICNRSGEDNGTLFAGTSTLLQLQEDADSPNVLGVMGRREEGVRIWTIV